MYNSYGEPTSGFSSLIFYAAIAGIIYLLVKKLLPWINKEFDKDYKWYHIPIAIIGAIAGLAALSYSMESSKRSEVSDRYDRLKKLSDEELMRIYDSGDDMDERATAQSILQTRIDRRKRMINK